MNPSESDITGCITDYLTLIGAWWLKVHGHLGQRKGIPDIIACFKGRFYGIEVKTERGEASDDQLAEIARIRKAGGTAFVARRLEDVMERMR